jgi:phage pi2 protein 07
MKIKEIVDIYKDIYIANIEFFINLFKKYDKFMDFVQDLVQNNGDIPVFQDGKFITLSPNQDSYLCIDSECFRKLRKNFLSINPVNLQYPHDYEDALRKLKKCLCDPNFLKLLLEIEKGNITGIRALKNFVKRYFPEKVKNKILSNLRELKITEINDAVNLIYAILRHPRQQTFKNVRNSTIVFYPFFSLNFTESSLKTLEKIQKNNSLANNIENIVQNLQIAKTLPTIREEQVGCVEKAFKVYINTLAKCLRLWSGNSSIDLLPEQKDLIKDWLYNANIYVEGVPGASKTFSGVASLLFAAIVDTTIVFPNARYFNYLITGNTYKSLKEFIKKLVDFSKCPYFKDFVSNLMEKIKCPTEDNIGLKGITIFFHFSKAEMERAGASNCEEYKEVLKKELNITDDSHIRVNCGCNSCRNLRNCLTIYIPFSERPEDDGLIFHTAVLRKVGAIQRCLYYVNSLHLEEASQIPFASFVELLYGLRDTQFFKIAQDTNNWWRFSFSGDPLQLSPIYQRADGVKNLHRLGIYYNLFTYFGTFSHNKRRLQTSLRVPKALVQFVEEFYGGEIKALKKSCECSFKPLELKYKSECENVKNLKKTFENILSYKGCLLRVEYTLKGKENFVRPRKYNPVEIKIAELITQVIEGCEKCSRAYLSPFRHQERELKLKFGQDPCVVVGTVDKLQGDEKDAVFFLTTVEDKDYATDLLDFIFNPNRLNVAITRTKKLFVLIHASTIGEIAFTEFNQAFEEDKNLFISSYVLHNMNVNPQTLENLLKFLNSNEGMFIFQKIISSTKHNCLGQLVLKFDENLSPRKGYCSSAPVEAEVKVYGL